MSLILTEPEPFHKENVLTSSDNLNDYNDLGVYSWDSSSVPTNAPFASTGSTLEVLPYSSSDTHRLQVAYATVGVAIRYRNMNGVWQDWKFLSSSTTCSATSKVTGMSAPTMRRSGNTVIAEIGLQLVDGTYTGQASGTPLWEFSPKPNGGYHFICSVSGSLKVMMLHTDGKVYFNSTTQISGSPYIIGECVYLTNG